MENLQVPAQRFRADLFEVFHWPFDQVVAESLHAWFEAPRNKVLENRLKAGLTVFACDPKLFTYSHPVRAPAAYRDGRLQRFVWLTD